MCLPTKQMDRPNRKVKGCGCPARTLCCSGYRMNRLLLWVGWLLVATGWGTDLLAADRVVNGIVFLDKNGNGMQDPGERGIRQVPVSNGRDVVYTGKQGDFQLPVEDGMSVFPILPSGYTVTPAAGRVKNTAFFYAGLAETGEEQGHIRFGLVRQQQRLPFRIGAVGDIQVGDAPEIAYAARSIFSELAQRDDIRFHLLLGDLVNDRMELLPVVRQLAAALPADSWALPGNHDRDGVAPRMDGTFNRLFGASDYAFHYGPVFFLVFNNVYPTGAKSYEGRLDERQLTFMARALERVPKDRQVVICQHIPLGMTRNREEILALLQPFKNVLVLSAHTHQVSRHFYQNGTVQELVAGAPSGNWWTGEKDASGVPHALMQCGSPRNYFTIDFDRTGYRLQFKAIGLDAAHQADILVAGNVIAANVFGGSDSTEVWMQVNGGDWIPMKKAAVVAPAVEAVIAKNREGLFPTPGNRANPLRRRLSPHVWTASLPSVSDPGGYLVRVRAADRFGFAAEASAVIYGGPPAGK